jgi:hypothetical protein
VSRAELLYFPQLLSQFRFEDEYFENGNCPSLFAALYLEFPELSLISYVKPIEKYVSFEPRTGTKSQIYSQVTGKLTTRR